MESAYERTRTRTRLRRVTEYNRRLVLILWFFFQAEDGIRDLTVTGVQTCALPISIAPGTPRTPGARRTFNVQLHLHGWILEQQRRWFHQNRLVWRERTHERISRRMQ